MKIIEGVQYDDAYWAARRGVPTASEFGCILTPKTGKLAAAADTYICRLIADLYDPLYPRKDDNATAAIRNGTIMEPEARAWYAMERDVNVREVSLCLTDDGRFGCSPDGLCGEDGVLELKCPSRHTHVEWLLAGELPSDYKAQVHGQLLVTGRKWVDFMSYCKPLPELLIRVEPDAYTAKLREALELFWLQYQTALAKIKGMK